MDRSISVQVSSLTDAASVVAGDNHTCAIRAAGGEVCWGSSSQGQLGVNPPVASSSVPVNVFSISGVAAIAGGGEHSCAITATDSVCWGDNGGTGDGNGLELRLDGASADPQTRHPDEDAGVSRLQRPQPPARIGEAGSARLDDSEDP